MIRKCINPKRVNYEKIGDKIKLNFKSFTDKRDYYDMPCGKCLYCMNMYSNSWAVRLMLESGFHSEMCFLTLTYDDVHLPANRSLRKKDVQDFLKRLRKSIYPQRVRFYATGEYGEKKGRPHYHIVLFGWVPNDLMYYKRTAKNEIIYTSEILTKLWKNGYRNSIGLNFSLKAMKYMGKYMAKLSDYDPLKQQPPFSTMSNRPGIGAWAFDIGMYETDGIYLEGKKYKIPKYFDKLAERDGFDLVPIKAKRDAKVKAYGNWDSNFQERLDYKAYVEKQGFTTDHLFTYGPRQIKLLKKKKYNFVTGSLNYESYYREFYGVIKARRELFFNFDNNNI